MDKKINIIIADDHKLFIDGLKSLLTDAHDINIAGLANNGREILSLLEDTDADIILMDIAMPLLNGIETTKIISRKYPSVKVIALTMFGDTFYFEEMINAGAKGFLFKTVDYEELILAIRNINQGNVYFAKNIPAKNNPALEGPKVADIKRQTNNLTKREIEIVKLFIQGLTYKEVAKRLNLSYYTVDTHRKKIFEKLGVHNISGLIKYAIENQIS